MADSRFGTRVFLASSGAALVLAVGCGSCGAEAPSAPADPAAVEGADEAASAGPVGTIEGVVRLAAGAELPAYPVDSAERQATVPEACSPPKITDQQPVQLSSGGLSGVLVAASEFDGDVDHEPTEHAVRIRDCRAEPRLVTATRGDSLVITNEDDYPFMPTMGPSPFMQALLKGQSRTLPLEQGGIQRLGCGFSAPCGRTDVVVLLHPIHTTTGEGGRFRLTNVPAGQEIPIHAWHPLFEEGSARVRVNAGETHQVEITLTPAPPAPAPPAEGAEAPGPAEDRPGLF